MTNSDALPVVIVGGGPVGLTAAIELLHYGFRPLIIEAKPEITWSSRAICISRRSLEIYDRLGLGETFVRKGLGWTRGQSFYRLHKVFDLEMPHGAADRHPPFINLQQFYTETFLVDAVKERGGEIRWATKLTGITERPDGLTLTIESGGRTETVDAAFVVAADGARSTVREELGLSLEGTSYEGRYLIADIEIRSPRPIERRVWFDPPSNPGSTIIIHIQPDDIWRIDYQLRDDEDAEQALREDNVRARIQSHLELIGERAPWRLHWRSLYRAHCLSLASYRHGRVLFAGDAAHLVPIFGVRGLNSGIEDAHNLGWKLAFVLKGLANSAILDSYSVERRAATMENIAQATKSTWFMSPPTDGFKLMRDAVLSLAVDHPFVRPLINPRQSAPFAYPGSPLSSAADRQATLAPGAPLPNLRLSGGAHLHSRLNRHGFTLLTRPGGLSDKVRAWAAAGNRLLAIAESPESMGEAAYLVRPDEHVAAAFERPTIDALEQALGRATAQEGQRYGAAVHS